MDSPVITFLLVAVLLLLLFAIGKIREINQDAEMEQARRDAKQFRDQDQFESGEYTEYEQTKDRMLDRKEQDRIDEMRGK